MHTEEFCQALKAADEARIADHEEAERAYQKRFSDALKSLDKENGGERQ